MRGEETNPQPESTLSPRERAGVRGHGASDHRELAGPGKAPCRSPTSRKALLALALILTAFLAMECFLPLGTAVQIGADEGFNLAKATLLLKGFKLYSDVWSDQPPLHTALITQVLKHVSPSVLGPRLVTVGFATLLLASLFVLVLRTSGLIVAALATTLVVASPGFLELASSCMLEIPALATGIAALAALSSRRPGKWYLRELLAGIIFAAALQIKFSPGILLPLAALIIALQHAKSAAPTRSVPSRLFVLGASVAIAWPAIDLIIDRGAYLAHFHQSWISHFAGPRSFEYGSPNDHRFDWTILLKNWDATIPAIIGIWFCLRNLRRPSPRSNAPTLQRSNAPEPRRSDDVAMQLFNPSTPFLPFAWLALSLAFFSLHHPWWTYYYIHIAIPLCWCAAFGIAALVAQTSSLLTTFREANSSPGATNLWRAWEANRRFPIGSAHPPPAKPEKKNHRLTARIAILSLFALSASAWMAGRLYLQAAGIRNSPQTYYDLALTELQRYKPFTHWIYSDEPIYSFHSGIAVPPQFAVLSLKRLWSGDMTNDRIAAEVQSIKPGLILLRNDTRALPFQDLMNTEYRLVYQDDHHRLYAHRDISEKPF